MFYFSIMDSWFCKCLPANLYSKPKYWKMYIHHLKTDYTNAIVDCVPSLKVVRNYGGVLGVNILTTCVFM